jgi:orotate phosphoribosyltransferase
MKEILAARSEQAQRFARITARTLLEINAVHFNSDKPFIFTSGKASPVYIDCRRIIAFPRARRALMQMGADLLREQVGFEVFDAVAGGETAGIPFAAWLAEDLDLPMLYVRKQPKGFGRMAQIEGHFDEGARTLLVEDLTTDGGSKVKFVEALRQAGAVVAHTFVIFHYGIFPQSLEAMKKLNVSLHALATWWDMLAIAKELGYFETHTLDEVEKFLHAPVEWSAAHGGRVDPAA